MVTTMKCGPRRAGASPERFNYFYSENELAAFVKPIHELASQTRQVHVMMNNCYRNNAQVNAQQLSQKLRLT